MPPVSTKQIVERIAKQIALARAEDLPALVQIQEQLDALAQEPDGPVGESAKRASDAINSIIFRETDEPDEAFKTVCDVIEYAQDVLAALERGEPIDSVKPAGAADDAPIPSGPVDEELLTAWIESCREGLGEVEACAVQIESAEDPAEQIAEIRRRVHTIKGECGVLSLHQAQDLCHKGESLIDECLSNPSDGRFPVDAILALVDWIKDYTTALESDPRATPPPHRDLAIALGGTSSEPDGTTADDQPDANDAAGAESADRTSGSADEPGAEPETGPAAPEASSAQDSESSPADDDDEPVTYPSDLGMDENLNDFLCEAREHIAGAEEALLTLESDPTDSELLNTVFRAFHTIKGVAGFMNLDPIVTLAHNAEALLDSARTGTLTLGTGHMDVILASCDMLTQLIGLLEGSPAPTRGALRCLVQSLKCLVEGREPEPGKVSQGLPHAPVGEIIIELGLASEDQVREALHRQADTARKLRTLLLKANLTSGEPVEREMVKGGEPGDQISEMIGSLGVIEPARLAQFIEAARDAGKRLGEVLGLSPAQMVPVMREQRRRTAPTPAAGPKGGATKKRRADQTVKVNTSRMDNLVNMVGELVIAQQMVVQDSLIHEIKHQRTRRNLTHVVKIIRDLQEVAMSLRMVTVKGTFQKMARLVRDVSAKAHKRIDFQMEGEDTELDRNVVEEIADPLVHMIRNACDHGIEPESERVAAGKPPAGTLTLRAYHQGGSIIIEVQDDGRGLNREKILSKAIERGLVPADRDPGEIPDAEVYNMVFLPGFSTADKVTDISGRGVGMDVVRRNIEALRGKVEIKSSPGKGSTFVMRLPLTMAIIDGMVVRVGTQRYVVPTLAIEQSFRPTPDQIHTAGGGRGEMAMVRGSLLPIHRLNRLFDLHEGIEDPTEALLIAIETNDTRFCLMVDEILDQQQVVIKTLGQGVGSIRGVSGGAILGDGRVAPILDVSVLVSEATTRAA